MHRLVLNVALKSFSLALLLAGLLATPAQAQTPPHDAAAAWKYLRALPADQREEVIEREAKREGGLVLYGATGLDRAQFWIGEFHKRYPDIPVEFVRLQATELYEKIAAERQTGKLRADLVITTITYLDLLKDVGAFAPYESVNWPDFDKHFRMGGYDQGWTAVVYEIFPHAIAWRTDRVKAEDAPKSNFDLTDPKWRGRLGTTTHREDFLNGVFMTLGEDKGMELAQALAAQDSRLYRSHAALSDALAAGEVDVAWDLIAARAIDLAAKGAPVDYVIGKPELVEGNTISIGHDTTHPYASALFLDVMLSPEVLESSDKWQGGRIFGNTKGAYSVPRDKYPNLLIFPALPPERYKQLNRLSEDLFIRGEN